MRKQRFTLTRVDWGVPLYVHSTRRIYQLRRDEAVQQFHKNELTYWHREHLLSSLLSASF